MKFAGVESLPDAEEENLEELDSAPDTACGCIKRVKKMLISVDENLLKKWLTRPVDGKPLILCDFKLDS